MTREMRIDDAGKYLFLRTDKILLEEVLQKYKREEM